MKAHMPKKEVIPPVSVTGPGPYHGHPIRLTIGLIVKNEEKTLDRCLGSLKPLMEAVESELIVTDTGSTDRTVEIAQKYTDHIIRFEWRDDFSAARNTGLEEARGEWFLFLDGDEWFEDTSGLIGFFTSGECDKYGSASYLQRNYSDDSGEKYVDFPVLRITRMYPGVQFKNIIHESLRRVEPLKFLDDYVHHYGYVYHSEEERQKKFERNGKLLRQALEEDPHNLKAYFQMAKQCAVEDRDLAEEYCLRGLEAERERPDRGWRLPLQHVLVNLYYESKKYEKALELAEEIVLKESESETYWLDFHSCAQSAAFFLQEYGRSAEHGKAYLQIYRRYEKGEFSRLFEMVDLPRSATAASREMVLRLLVETGFRMEDSELIWETLEQLDFSGDGNVAASLQLVRRACERKKDWNKFAGFYQKAVSQAEEDRRPALRRAAESVLLSVKGEQRPAAARAVAETREDGDPYVRLCRLREAEREEDREAAARELTWFFRWNGAWDPLYSDVLFYAMKEPVDLMPLVLKIDSEDLKYYAADMEKRHRDFAGVVQGYFGSFSCEGAGGLYWSICLREKVLLTKPRPFETEENEIRFFEEYARQCAQYARTLYRPELLSPDRISMLPRAHRFGYCMGRAFSARKREDHAEYLSDLRLALRNYPVMKRQITLLLERFEREEELRREKAEEFGRLAKQVKEKIRDLIAQGKLKEAGQVTLQLAALLPNDPDVVRFRTLTHTEPDMNEIASRLPQ